MHAANVDSRGRRSAAEITTLGGIARRLAGLLAAALLAACGGGGGADFTQPTVTAGPLARLEVTPAAVTLTTSNQSMTLKVRGFDANGIEITGLKPSFASTHPEQIAVSDSGQVGASASVGSALVVARVGDIAAAPVTAMALKLAPGVIAIGDAQITSPPALLDPGTGLSPRFRARVDAGLNLVPGSLVVGTGQTALAGQVLAVRPAGTSVEIDVEVTPIETLVTDLSLDLQFQPDQLQLIEDPAPSSAGAKSSIRSVGRTASQSFRLGPFTCTGDIDPSILTGEFEASISPPSVSFKLQDVIMDGRNVGGEAFAEGSLQVAAKAILRLGATATGAVSCSFPFTRLNVPVFGLASFIAAPSIPLRFDSEFTLAVSAAAFTFGAQGTATVDLKLGLAWDEQGGATPFNTFDVTNTFVRTAEFPEDAGVRVKGTLFLGAGSGLDLSIGNIGILSLTRLELVKIQAGPEFEAKFGSLYDAAVDPTYTTEYELKLKLAASPGDSVAEIVRHLTASARSLDMSAKVEKSLGKSPHAASVNVDVARFNAGDTLTFGVNLDSTTLSFPGLGYNVKEVRIYRLNNNLGQTGAELIASAPAADAQSTFVLPWVAPDAGDVFDSITNKPNFYAFVVDDTLDVASSILPFELGAVVPAASNKPLFKIAEIGTASFAIGTDGLLRSVGRNNGGALGAGLPIGQIVTTPVVVSGLTDVRSVTGNAWFAVALLGDGTVWAWGWGDTIGSSIVNNPLPRKVFSDRVLSVSSGTMDTAVLTEAGQVFRFGSSGVAELDNGLPDIVAVAQGKSHTLLLTRDGKVWAVGSNHYGQIGDPDTSFNAAVPIAVPGPTDVVAIAAGQYHSLALGRDGSLWAWGSNGVGQVGVSPARYPLVSTPTLVPLTNVSRIAAGEYHTLALVNGTAYAWGSNGHCQLGTGDAGPVTAPRSILTGIADIDGGEFGSLFTLNDGTVLRAGASIGGSPDTCTPTDTGLRATLP